MSKKKTNNNKEISFVSNKIKNKKLESVNENNQHETAAKKNWLDKLIAWANKKPFVILSDTVHEIKSNLKTIREKAKQKRESKWQRIKALVSPDCSTENMLSELEHSIDETKKEVEKENKKAFLKGVVLSFFFTALGTLLFSGFALDSLTRLLFSISSLEADISGGDIVLVIGENKKNVSSITYLNDHLEAATRERLNAAALLAKEKDLPIMLAGTDEAIQAMKASLKKNYPDITEDRIYLEEPADNVIDKAVNTFKLCTEKQASKPIVFTTPYKMPRTICQLKRHGLKEAKPYLGTVPEVISTDYIVSAAERKPATTILDALSEYIKIVYYGCW